MPSSSRMRSPTASCSTASEAAGTYNDEDVMALAARASAYASMARRGPLAIVPRKIRVA